jgi:hypothetical protein
MNALSKNTKITVSDINTLISELNGKLNLSGGTMTGTITFSSGRIGELSTKEFVLQGEMITSSSYSNCPALVIRTKDHTSDPGSIGFYCRNQDITNVFMCSPTNGLTYNNKHIVRSVNGIQASNDGNCILPYFTDIATLGITKYSDAPNGYYGVYSPSRYSDAPVSNWGSLLSWSEHNGTKHQKYYSDNENMMYFRKWSGTSEPPTQWQKFGINSNGRLCIPSGEIWIA